MLDIAPAIETVANNTKDLQNVNRGAQLSTGHPLSKNKIGKPLKSVECYYCGGAHFMNNCGFKDSVCHNCQKKGHIAKKFRKLK